MTESNFQDILSAAVDGKKVVVVTPTHQRAINLRQRIERALGGPVRNVTCLCYDQPFDGHRAHLVVDDAGDAEITSDRQKEINAELRCMLYSKTDSFTPRIVVSL